jgi:Bacterial regulatory proteins, gntR family
LTIAQLSRAWTAEILGAERDPQQFEQELVHLLLEDIVNKRLDDAGPLVEGRRLGLRIVTPDRRAGFLDGDQARDLLLPGGAWTFHLDRIVVLKEAALDFAHRHALPPPSWWSDAVATSTKPADQLPPDDVIKIPSAPSKNRASLKRRRGAKPEKLERVKEAMKNDIRQGRRTVAELSNMREKDLAAEYNVSRDTARKARNAVSEFVENSILDK